jgi:hypothetical protein
MKSRNVPSKKTNISSDQEWASPQSAIMKINKKVPYLNKNKEIYFFNSILRPN